MLYPIYTILTTAALLPGAAWMLANPKHRPLLRRLHPQTPAQSLNPLWIHACSVGEVRTATPILQAARRRWPQVPLLLTTSTLAGHKLAEESKLDAHLTFLPFDHPFVVRAFLRQITPRALILIETEIWPALLRETHRANVPIALVNGRLSDKHFPRYRRSKALLRPFWKLIDKAAMQNETYRNRAIELGLRPDRVVVIGNTKFDGAKTEVSVVTQDKLRRECGIAKDELVLVFGSTRPGDETLAIDTWRELRRNHPKLRLVIVPRHIDRVTQITPMINEPILLRSAMTNATNAPTVAAVIVVDTLGELTDFYAIATIAVVGGSFYPGVEGHNPIEPAALGIPTIFGPYMRNFADPAHALVDAEGAIQIERPESLKDALQKLLADPKARTKMGESARLIVQKNQGAIDKTIELLDPLLAATPSHHPDSDPESTPATGHL